MEKTVLIIDAEPTWRDRFCAELEAEGFHVLTAADSGEAFSHLENIAFDLVISEVGSPLGRDLENLNEYLKRREEAKLVITSEHPELKNDFRIWIADAFVIKSDDLSELKATVKSLLIDENKINQSLN